MLKKYENEKNDKKKFMSEGNILFFYIQLWDLILALKCIFSDI